MSVTEILIRTMSGFVFVVPVLIVYFICLKRSGKGQTPLHIAAAFVFCYYLIGVLTMTGIGRLYAFAPRIVLIPFLDMIRGPIDTVLNVILFVPLGFFLPLLYQKYDHLIDAIRTGFLFSLSVELVQMFGRGATDINDLITNTAGACFGFFLYRWMTRRIPKDLYKRFQADHISGRTEAPLFIVASFVSMVTIQPYVISRLFRLG